jgi:hypothetical protein
VELATPRSPPSLLGLLGLFGIFGLFGLLGAGDASSFWDTDALLRACSMAAPSADLVGAEAAAAAVPPPAAFSIAARIEAVALRWVSLAPRAGSSSTSAMSGLARRLKICTSVELTTDSAMQFGVERL